MFEIAKQQCVDIKKTMYLIYTCIIVYNYIYIVHHCRWVLYGTMGGRTVEGDLLGKLLSKRGQLLTSLLRSRSLQVTIQYL